MSIMSPIFRKQAAEKPLSSDDRSIGAILLDTGKLSLADAERILQYQKQEGCRFGEAGIKLGLLTEADCCQALATQFDFNYLVPGDSCLSMELVAAYQPNHQATELFRALRSQLMLRWFGAEQHRRALAIVSPRTKEGRTYLAANLAVVFSQLGERTLLIDAGLRASRVGELFGLKDALGLSSILAGRADTRVIQSIAGLERLSVLPAGIVPPNPQELLERAMFNDLLKHLAEEFDVILIDTPPGSEHADAHSVAAAAGAAVMITRQYRTRLEDARALTEKIRGARAEIVGSVLTGF